MKKIARAFLFSVLMLGCIFAQTATVWAGEHGGKEHGGATHAMQAQGETPAMNRTTLLKEAAAALREGTPRPDLADALEKLAQ